MKLKGDTVSDSQNSQRPIGIIDQAITVDGAEVNMYGGAVHYWRLDRQKWDEILDSVKNMGFNMISIYIPWEAHEIERGRFDFGEINPSNDIDAFLSLCEKKGFRVIVRPGPQINSELTWFGYPKRILANERLHAVSGQGSKVILTQVPKPIPALNYACDEFFEETALWYDAICAILAKHAYPNGGIVAAQVDNEMAYFFGVNAYIADYSVDSLALYRDFLLNKYSSLDAVNDAYGTSHSSLAGIDPPRRFAATGKQDIPWYADWAEYREHYLINSMDRLANMMRERGLSGIALFHNYPHPLGPGGAASGYTAPFNIAKLEEKLDFVGFDIYSRKELFHHVKTVASYVVGTSRYPYIPEFIAGVWPWYLNPGDWHDEEFVTKAALMQGIRGFSRYMLVERDRWLDSPIRRDGRERADKVKMFASVNEMLDTSEMHRFRRDADVLLLANREYDRLEAASVLVSFPGDFLETPSGFSEYAGPLTMSEARLGFDEPIQVAKSEWFAAFENGLNSIGVGPVLSDTDLNPSAWSARQVVVLTTLDYLDEATQRSLVAFAESGKTVVIGPKVPSLNSSMKPCTILGDALGDLGDEAVVERRIGDGHILVATSPAAVTEALERAAEISGTVRIERNDPRLDATVHSARDSATEKLVFVANPTPDEIEARVAFGVEIESVAEVWDGRSVRVEGSAIEARMQPYSINIYRCVFAA
jgi:beta-galactosidase